MPLLAAATGILLRSRRRRSALLSWTAVVGGHILNLILEAVYDRPRPTVVPYATAFSSKSSPSGHAMAAPVAYASMALLLGRAAWAAFVAAAALAARPFALPLE